MDEIEIKDAKNSQEEVEKCQKERDECLDNWKRERADFVNYKKDEVKRMAEFAKYANEALILELVGVVDDLIVARNNAPPDDKWAEGFDGAMRKMESLLKKYGLEKIDTAGKFDPHLHEAVAVSSEALSEGREMEEGGEKIQEVSPGYTMDGKVIRPAKVKIIK